MPPKTTPPAGTAAADPAKTSETTATEPTAVGTGTAEPADHAAADGAGTGDAAGTEPAAAAGAQAVPTAAASPTAAADPVAGEPGACEAAEATAETVAGDETETGEEPGKPEGARRGLRMPALLAAAAVLLGGFGAGASVAAHNLRASAAGQNVALTDAATTAAVKRQVASAVDTIFSYSYTDTAATRRRAQSLLTGAAIQQYNRLYSLVQQEAPAQKLIVTTRVTNSGVEFLDGARARVLVFANQQDTRGGTHQASYAGTMFAVTAVRAGGRWKIGNIDTFTGG